jgi:3-oxoadipate enol-lactonase
MEKVQVNGTGMNFEKFDGLLPFPTLFLHGNLASTRWWHPTAELFKAEPAGNGALIAADWRGCGQSDAPKEGEALNIEDLAKDYIELVKHLGFEQVDIVGHSTGGLIAVVAMGMEPGLFRNALLLDPVGLNGVSFDDSMIAAFEQMQKDKNITAAVIGGTIYNNDSSSDYFNNVLVEDAQVAVNQVGIPVLRMLDGINCEGYAKKVTARVSVLHGEHDELLPVADSKAIAEFLANGSFHTIPGHGHCTNVESPETFKKCLETYLYG